MKISCEICFILVITIASSKSTILKCKFQNDLVWNMYGCDVLESKNNHRDARITSIEGQHQYSMSHNDVLSIFIENTDNMTFFTNDFFVKFPNVHNLLIQTTPLQHLYRGDFVMADKLINVHITNTQLSYLEDYVFYATKVLESINLRENKIGSIEANAFHGLKNLKYLTLSYNELQSLHATVFNDLSSMELLSLSNNKLHHLDEQLFIENRNLIVIFLGNNQLRTVSGNIFAKNDKLEEIYMEHNLIKHISNVQNFLVNLRQLKMAVFSNNTCVDTIIPIFRLFPPYELIFDEC